MAKVLKVKEDVISIGTDDGKIKQVRRDDVSFDPKVGDEVEIYESSDDVIVTKKEKQSEQTAIPAGGININLNNTQTNGNDGYYNQNSGYKIVNKTVYCILAFFLGGIGMHKFYAGKVGEGIFYLILCWTFIPSIIAFIEFIIALCKRADANGNILI